jgi:uncharacterized protein YecE (DUF72 family)
MGLESYAREFSTIEVQTTFYRLPKVSTVERWRRVAPNLTFTMKAFQGITHPPESPTWRRSKAELRDVDPAEVGLLKVSKFTLEAWKRTEQLADALDAKVIVVQLPPSFDYGAQNVSRLREFLSSVSTVRIPAVEFRHASWFPRLQEARETIAFCDGIVVTDPLKMEPPAQPLQYHRMHGSGGMVNYKHRYTDDELECLEKRVRGKEAYVFFNNLAMKEDAKRFLRTAQASTRPVLEGLSSPSPAFDSTSWPGGRKAE